MTLDIETYSDADFFQRFVYQTSGGVPIDLGTDVLRMMVRSHPSDATAHIERSSLPYGGITITDTAGGAFALAIPVALLATLQPGVYSHSLIKTDATFTSRKDIWRGTLTHRVGPTRWKTGTFV